MEKVFRKISCKASVRQSQVFQCDGLPRVPIIGLMRRPDFHRACRQPHGARREEIKLKSTIRLQY
jgi:hypothetical protein